MLFRSQEKQGALGAFGIGTLWSDPGIPREFLGEKKGIIPGKSHPKKQDLGINVAHFGMAFAPHVGSVEAAVDQRKYGAGNPEMFLKLSPD